MAKKFYEFCCNCGVSLPLPKDIEEPDTWIIEQGWFARANVPSWMVDRKQYICGDCAKRTAPMTMQNSIEILNEHKHISSDETTFSNWRSCADDLICNANDCYLNEFEAVAIAEKYLRG